MAELAIKGHSTRGKEVIEILEMLGGKSKNNIKGYNDDLYYYIAKDGLIYGSGIKYEEFACNYTIFTLEEFLEKYPYKVGDKVCYQPNLQIDTICISEIISMKWADNSVIYFTSNGHSLYACDLQPYKEEIIEEGTNKAVFEGNAQSCDIMNDIIKEESMEEKGTLEQIDLTRELRIADEVEVILGDYEFVLKDGKTYFVKKKPQYPKTYKECCKVLMGKNDFQDFELVLTKISINGYEGNSISLCPPYISLINNFYKLLICRDAYWKIAGEQMGLDKSWKPDWKDDSEIYYTISYKGINIKCYNNTDVYSKLAFPTAEMRDAFYENFKDTIEGCKELF